MQHFETADENRYLLCASGEERLIEVTASSEHDQFHRAERSCLDSIRNGDNLDGRGNTCVRRKKECRTTVVMLGFSVFETLCVQ